MQAFTTLTAKVMPLDRPNVDTDAIIPKQYLKSISRTGFGPFLFDDWRYLDPGTLDIDPATRRPNPDFVLNDAAHAGSRILVARDNFGCGSSREHAVWALDDYGFRAVIAPSYADIFFSNCFKNGVLPVVLTPEQVQAVFVAVEADANAEITIDLPAQQVRLPDGSAFAFDINPHHKHNLVNGLDEIGLTLTQADDIRAYEARRRIEAPWLF
ncbi:3-isopropylmalate dehydratase small subunit [Flagellatimonas centrodinii]|uniref:3-isopropylmalate dehydratase small subunit n=1 Tax=Flagellatimonas centrodinii TaxID=2806210 RepID=UPI001FFD614E|nr:3-isopropylmalate dehydratase small subunit [Flagellatimonas centrodinii]ULQ46377.1 3-isopropylmalate dehydratase small subunit [Flagellatimonas centrodinii]